MNRNVVLFGCFCLGASALMLYFRPRASHSVVPSASVAVAPVEKSSASGNNLPAIASVSTTPVISATLERPGNFDTVTQMMIATADVPVVEQKTVRKDKFAALRELSALAARDPEAALAAAVKLPEGSERTDALKAVCSGLAQKDPADAVKLAQELQLDKQPGAVMEDLVQQWAGSDLVSSMTWVEAQPAGGPRDEMTTRVAYVMSRNDPSDAATLVMNEISPGPVQDEAIMAVLHQWANQNFVAAANWAKDTVSGPLQERALNELQGILDYQHALAQQ